MLATRQFAARHPEFARRGVALVAVFRSPVAALRGYAEGPGAVPFPVLADPRREAARAWGVPGGWRALLSLRALRRVREARAAGLAPRWRDALRDGIGGSPADFLVGEEGRVVALHRGAHFADSIAPAVALAWIDAARTAQGGATP